ncbi:flagellar basal-body MS-ring/collar protein FliF [Alloiococcus sp. CFN-8]|uniref:flagellar basal-body MS-ring/collar protein FliF n=1 Tax=Alloiococcus sp. CFN-8 TaxID=3416081 RepID=UPI003CF717A7
MNIFTDGFKKLWENFNNKSKKARIAIITSSTAVLLAIILIIFMSFKDKYGLLFSELENGDAQTVVSTLEEKGIDYKIQGNSIHVPEEMVDKLRLELASSLTLGSTGFELMDEGNSFGMTKEEFEIKKLRMLQGEMERTIKSFPQIDSARVHITMAEKSVFIDKDTPGSAAIYLDIKEGKKLESEQVKAIIALVSGGTDNIPVQNIQVIDERMNLLSKDLFDEDGKEVQASGTVENLKTIEKDFERELENKILEHLSVVLGKGNATVTVAADLDFDSKESTQIIYSPDKVIVSETYKRDRDGDSQGNLGSSPVDNEMSNTIGDMEDNGIISEEGTINYEVGSLETVTITAPGEVKRLTASIIVNGNKDAGTLEDLKEVIKGSLGINEERGDEISVVSMNFDTAAQDALDKQIAAIEAQEAKEKKIRLYSMAVLGMIGVIAIISIIVIIMRNLRRKEDEELILGSNLNTVVGEEITPKPVESFEPIAFEEENEKLYIEKEIKSYAHEKPEQVADIIKAWLTEDER